MSLIRKAFGEVYFIYVSANVLLTRFILAKNDNHSLVIDTFINNSTLNEYETLALLKTICHLFRKNHIVDISEDILSKTVEVLKKAGNNTEQIKYVLTIFYKIFIHKDEIFTPWKQQVSVTENR